MVRCPACECAIGDQRVCPECGTSVDAQTDHSTVQTVDSQQHRSTDHQQSNGHQQTGRHATDGPSKRRTNGQVPLPTGLKLLCGLLALLGLGSLGFGMQLRQVGSTATRYGVSGGSIETVGLAMLALGVGELAAAIGLWSRKSWGWTVAMAVTVAGVLANAYLLTTAAQSSVGLVGMAVNGGLAWYIYGQRWRYRDGTTRQRPPTTQRQHSHSNRSRRQNQQ